MRFPPYQPEVLENQTNQLLHAHKPAGPNGNKCFQCLSKKSRPFEVHFQFVAKFGHTLTRSLKFFTSVSGRGINTGGFIFKVRSLKSHSSITYCTGILKKTHRQRTIGNLSSGVSGLFHESATVLLSTLYQSQI